LIVRVAVAIQLSIVSIEERLLSNIPQVLEGLLSQTIQGGAIGCVQQSVVHSLLSCLVLKCGNGKVFLFKSVLLISIRVLYTYQESHSGTVDVPLHLST
jgi:hypothetical protein